MVDKTGIFSTGVQAKDITFDAKGAARIRSAALLNTFVVSTPDALAKLEKHVAKISEDDVTIDEDGRIVIHNPEFINALRTRMTSETADDTNYVCKNAHACGAQ